MFSNHWAELPSDRLILSLVLFFLHGQRLSTLLPRFCVRKGFSSVGSMASYVRLTGGRFWQSSKQTAVYQFFLWHLELGQLGKSSQCAYIRFKSIVLTNRQTQYYCRISDPHSGAAVESIPWTTGDWKSCQAGSDKTSEGCEIYYGSIYWRSKFGTYTTWELDFDLLKSIFVIGKRKSSNCPESDLVRLNKSKTSAR